MKMNKILITNFKRPIGLSPHAPVAQKIAGAVYTHR